MAETGGEQGTYRVAEDIPQQYYNIELKFQYKGTLDL
jgi:hypothetical protein